MTDRHRKWLFVGATFVMVLIVLEIGARGIEFVQKATTRDPSPFVKASNPVDVFVLDESGSKPVHRRSPHHQLIHRPQEFEAVKSPGTLRVFMLGGSAAAGWPHVEYSMTELLARKLEQLYPDRVIEVLNVAGGTYASHRVRFVFDEVIEYEPDLLLIYSGNNEFLENFVFGADSLSGPLGYSALARTIHASVTGLLEQRTFDVENYSLADQSSNRLAYAFGKASKYRQDPEQFEYIQEHYRYNIESMIEGAKERGVPVILLDVPVNLKDWIPNVSVHREDLDASELARWTEEFRRGYVAIELEDYETAAAALERAIAIDDEYAEAHYYLGVANQRLGRLEEAREHYQGALVRDAYPFRALPEFQAILSELAVRHEVPLIGIVGLLERMSVDGIIGDDVLLDYVHLTARSQEAVAQEILVAMDEAGLLPRPRATRVDSVRIDVPGEFEATQPEITSISVYGTLVGQYLVMRQYDKLDRVIERLVTLDELHGDRVPGLALRAKRARQIKAVIDPYRRLLRAEKLGTLEGEFTEARARAIYSDYVALIHQIEARDVSREEFWNRVPELEYGGRKASPPRGDEPR